MNYALIQNNVVSNIIFLNPKNAFEFPNAVSVDNLPVTIGDIYEDGKFYRDGVEVVEHSELEFEESTPTLEEQLNAAYQEGVNEA